MRLLFSTEEFLINGEPAIGHPLLFTREMELHRAVNNFLIEARFERGLSVASVTTYAWALYDYFSWVEAQGHTWEAPWTSKQPRLSLLSEYRAWQVKLSGTGHRLSERTIRYYLKICDLFYRWADENNYLHKEIEQVSPECPPSSWHHGLRLEGRRPSKNLVKALSLEQIRAVLAATHDETARLMIILSLSTGLRRSEVTSFSAALVADPISAGADILSRIPIEICPSPPGAANEPVMDIKGGVSRRIFVPAQVMRALYDYSALGRRVHNAKKYELKYKRTPDRLFISGRGEPYGKKFLNRVCANISSKVGFRLHPHMLRHTFAVHELAQESLRRSPTNALVWLRDRLGHASIETTTIYTNLLAELTDTAISEYHSLLAGLTNGRWRR